MTTDEQVLQETGFALAGVRRPNVWRSSLRAIYVIWYRDMVRLVRDRMRFVMSFTMPILYLGIFGTGLSSSLGRGFAIPGLSYIQYLFPGVIGMTVLMSGLMGAMSIVWDREFGFLKEVLVAPINGSAVAVGKALGGATQAMIQAAVIMLLAPIIGVHLTVLSAAELLVLAFVLAFAIASLGVLISTRIKTMQSFQVVMNLLMMPMFFLSGALFLFNGLPDWMAVLTRLDPAAYGVDALRRVALEGGGMPGAAVDKLAITVFGSTVPIAADVGILAAVGLVTLALAARGFARRD